MPSSPEDKRFMQEGAAQAAALLRSVGNESRLLVLCLLIEHGELTVGELLAQVPLSQSALSQHLARMRDEGLVSFRRTSQTLHYRIANPDVARLIATLKAIFCPPSKDSTS
ncbi:DNA-binding transcriptional ArsR family regulator [Pigmentiphaga kullae]|uniref:DNA-binding transcriptional ArsR family regulator n=3 Tax=Alcaligenaceae TaxID=506 RepID=A0A4Q7NDM0_9BURK|nr:DNA-binding transcriptional ArsR family regulator [Pigmentiphaga kullae]